MGRYRAVRKLISQLKTLQNIRGKMEEGNIDISSKKKLLKLSQEKQVKSLIQNLYRDNATIGNGSAADALRYEKRTGILLSPTGHRTKVVQRINQINNLLRKNPNRPDNAILWLLREDLKNALKEYNDE